MEEINLKDLFKYILKRIVIIISVTVAFTILGFIYGRYIKTPMYKSYSSIILVSEQTETKLSTSDIQLNKSLVSTYQEVIKSRKILEEVIEELELPYEYETLYDKVTVSSSDDTSIIKITVVDEDNIMAYKITNKIATVFVKVIPSYFDISNVNILDKGVIKEDAYNINYLKDTFIFMIIGLILSTGTVFVLFYFDRSITCIEQIEKIGLPILGRVHEEKVGGEK